MPLDGWIESSQMLESHQQLRYGSYLKDGGDLGGDLGGGGGAEGDHEEQDGGDLGFCSC